MVLCTRSHVLHSSLFNNTLGFFMFNARMTPIALRTVPGRRDPSPESFLALSGARASVINHFWPIIIWPVKPFETVWLYKYN